MGTEIFEDRVAAGSSHHAAFAAPIALCVVLTAVAVQRGAPVVASVVLASAVVAALVTLDLIFAGIGTRVDAFTLVVWTGPFHRTIRLSDVASVRVTRYSRTEYGPWGLLASGKDRSRAFTLPGHDDVVEIMSRARGALTRTLVAATDPQRLALEIEARAGAEVTSGAGPLAALANVSQPLAP